MIPLLSNLQIGFDWIGSFDAEFCALLMQIDEQTARNLQPDTTTHLKLSAVLAFLGLIVLIVGMFMMLWMISRYARRNFVGEPADPGSSPFAEFGYKHRGQFKPPVDDEDDAPPRRSSP